MESIEKSNQNIELSEKEFKEFYETFGSSNLKLQGQVLGDLGDKELNIYFKSIGFATTVVGVVGLIAGFGFTAFEYVQNSLLFFIGESFLLGALFYGLFWTQQKYQGEFNSLEQERKKYIAFYEKRNEKLFMLCESWLKTHSINKDTFIELNEIDKKSIDLFKNDDKRTTPRIYSQAVYIFMILGSAILLSSFFIIDLFRFFFRCYS